MRRTIQLNAILAAWIVLPFLFFTTMIHAQDATLAGPSSCGGTSTSGTWTVPCDVTEISIEVYGGGGGAGGGGGGSAGGVCNTYGGGAGGGGGFTTITINVIPGSVFNYTAAYGGCGGSNGSDLSDGGNGNPGGNSTFSGLDAFGNPVNLTANGGARGTGGDGCNVLGNGGGNGSGGAGGTATGGTTNTAGTAGGNGSGATGGTGGSASGPNGGSGGVPNNGAGGTYGGGGAGGGDSSGGRGAAGGILITYVTQGPLTPTVLTTPASCTSNGTATIGFYNAAITYTFTPSGPTVGSGGVISGLVPGTDYTVIASIGNCTSTSSQPFSVEAQLASPTVTVSGSLEYCTGSSTTITASGAQSYVWDDQAASTTAAITVMQGTYTVTGTDAGCSGQATVTVTEVLVPNVDLGVDQEVCSQTTVLLDAGAGATSYTWSTGANTQTAELGAGTYWVEASNGSCSASDTIVISELQNPEPQVVASGSLTICDGGTVTLDAGAGYASYLWQPNGEQTQTITVSASGSYSAEVTDGAGCSGASNAVEVTIQNVADAVISANGPLEICSGESVTLDAGAGYDTYLWSNGAVTQTINAASAGDYSVSGTLGGCPYSSNTVTVSVNSFSPEIAASGTELSVTGSYSSYQWVLNGDPIPGATGPTYEAIASGNYTVIVTDPNGCSGTSGILEYSLPVVDSIDETEMTIPFIMYPNPSSGQFQIEMEMSGPYTVAVLNTIGQVVYNEEQSNGNRSFVTLETSGMYVVQVMVDGRVYHKRIVIE